MPCSTRPSPAPRRRAALRGRQPPGHLPTPPPLPLPAGGPPFEAASHQDTYRRIVRVDLQFPAQPKLSDLAQDFIRKVGGAGGLRQGKGHGVQLGAGSGAGEGRVWGPAAGLALIPPAPPPPSLSTSIVVPLLAWP